MKKPSSATFLAMSCVGSLISAPGDGRRRRRRCVFGPANRARSPRRARADHRHRHSDYQTQSESPKSTRLGARHAADGDRHHRRERSSSRTSLTLRDMLSTVPGITFGAAEGGAPFRRLDQRCAAIRRATTSRRTACATAAPIAAPTPFNMEQLEIVNGANSVYGGSGSGRRLDQHRHQAPAERNAR